MTKTKDLVEIKNDLKQLILNPTNPIKYYDNLRNNLSQEYPEEYNQIIDLPLNEGLDKLVDKTLIHTLSPLLVSTKPSDLSQYCLLSTKELLSGFSKDFPENKQRLEKLRAELGIDKLVDENLNFHFLDSVKFYAFRQGLAFAYNLKRDYGNGVIEPSFAHYFKSKQTSFKLLKENAISMEYFECLLQNYKSCGFNGCEFIFDKFYNLLKGDELNTGYSIKVSTHKMEIMSRVKDLFSRYVDSAMNHGGKNLNLTNNSAVYSMIVDSFNIGRKVGNIIANPDKKNVVVSNKIIFEVPEYKCLISLVEDVLLPNNSKSRESSIPHNHNFYI